MFTISKAQLESFSTTRYKNFEARAMKYLEDEYPNEYQLWGKNGMYDLLQRSIKQTEHYGMKIESGVILWTEISIIYGENFYNDEPWALNILNNFGLDIESQMERLQGYIIK